jgi:O-succinylbenzoate synthase
MKVWVEVKPYERKFLRPLKTAHGPWQWRQGVWLKLRDSKGAMSYGEVAPIPWFGTESVHIAQEFLQGKIGWRDIDEILAVPEHLPATRFGIETALNGILNSGSGHPQVLGVGPVASTKPMHICGLLPAGEQALPALSPKIQQGYRVCKWKIGVFPMAQEIDWLKELVGRADYCCRLRLDANGGLTQRQAEVWLAVCDQLNSASDFGHLGESTTLPFNSKAGPIELVEQPLAPPHLKEMTQLGQQFQTPIAMDESVATLTQLKDLEGEAWPGLLVVKPAIAGSPHLLSRYLSRWGSRVIFSSAFETIIGRQAALEVAMGHYRKTLGREEFPALGFDTLGYFDDDWDQLTPAQLWERI